MHIKKDTLDDVLNDVFRSVRSSRVPTSPSAGAAKEKSGVLIELTNPRARFSGTENRLTLHSCLGETLWYFSNTDDLRQIEYYIPKYREKARIHESYERAPGAYGPRLFGGVDDINQVARVIAALNSPQKHDSRQAVIQIFDRTDIGHPDVPCTCTLQFLARGAKVHALTYMRSNDAYIGLPHDIFAFTWLQEVIARSIGHELGTYKHFVGSLHIYNRDMDAVEQYLNEGFQEPVVMPAMPRGNPWNSIKWLLKNEKHVRLNGGRDLLDDDSIDEYWRDLARILLLYAHSIDWHSLKSRKSRNEFVKTKNSMTSKVYEAYSRKREAKFRQDDQEPSLLGLASDKY